MVCRCSSPAEHANRAASQAAHSALAERRNLTTRHQGEKSDLNSTISRLEKELAGLTINADNYTVVDAVEVGTSLVMRVKYPSCRNCVHEGVKVMVFANTNAISALTWNRIDPHFRGPDPKAGEAPSPIARFPGTPGGWDAATVFAKNKNAGPA